MALKFAREQAGEYNVIEGTKMVAMIYSKEMLLSGLYIFAPILLQRVNPKM
jgi:hypothetical protein